MKKQINIKTDCGVIFFVRKHKQGKDKCKSTNY